MEFRVCEVNHAHITVFDELQSSWNEPIRLVSHIEERVVCSILYHAKVEQVLGLVFCFVKTVHLTLNGLVQAQLVLNDTGW